MSEEQSTPEVPALAVHPDLAEEIAAQMASPVDETIMCGICQHVGGAYPGCDLGCQGNTRHNIPRQYSLTEERQGLNKEEAARRYGRTGDVNPTIVRLPGSFVPGGQS